MPRRAALVPLIAALAACGQGTEPRGGNDRVTAIFTQGVSASVVDSAGKAIGTIAGRPGKQGLVVSIDVRGLATGEHGLHLHEAGRCDPPRFASAGAHWNISGRRHGHDNPAGPHDGDWGNLVVDADGRGLAERLIPRWHGKVPDSGLALVIHAGSDDERSDPAGNSGARIACAVLVPPAAPAP
jgi:Cu-Zn family superoxide dismutase